MLIAGGPPVTAPRLTAGIRASGIGGWTTRWAPPPCASVRSAARGSRPPCSRWRWRPCHLLPAQDRAGRLAQRGLPAGGAARGHLLGAGPGAADLAAERGAFNFFHLPPTGPVHDRRRSQLGRAGGVHHRRPVRQHAGRAGPRPAPRRPSAGAPRPIWPPRWPTSCCSARTPRRALASAARRVAEALELTSAAIEPATPRAAGSAPHPPPAAGSAADGAAAPRRRRYADGDPAGPRRTSPPDTEQRLRTQVVPTLEALVAIAQRRDAHAGRGWSRRPRCVAPTTSRRRCCAPSPTTCAPR